MKTLKFKLAILFVIFLSVFATGCLNNGLILPTPDVTSTLTNLEISPTEVSLDVGQTQVFTVIGKDQNGDPIDFSPSWSVSGEIGDVISNSNNTATFKALKSGQGTLTVFVEEITASASISVNVGEPNVLSTLEISPAEVSLDVGQTQFFSVIGKDQNGDPIDFTPSWSVTGEIGEIISNNENTVTLKALKFGQGTLEVSAEDITVTVTVNVQIAESRVVSFIESYNTYIVNEEAENLSNLYSDPFLSYYLDYEPQSISRDTFVAILNNIFPLEDFKVVDWNFVIEHNIATIDVILNNKGESGETNHNLKWIVKDLDGTLYIEKEYQL